MNIITRISAVAVITGSALVAAPVEAAPIQAYPICVQAGPNVSDWEGWIVDEQSDLDEAARFVTAPFPQVGNGGCSFYAYNPPQFTALQPTVVETSSVQTVDNPKLIAKIARQKAIIKHLRARLAQQD